MFKYKKDHLYKQCKFTPDWGGATPLDNWKIHEIVNKCRNAEEALSLCDGADLEEVDTIIRERITAYFEPEIKTYDALKEKIKNI